MLDDDDSSDDDGDGDGDGDDDGGGDDDDDGSEVIVQHGLSSSAHDILVRRCRRRGAPVADADLVPRRLGTLEVLTFCKVSGLQPATRIHYSGVSANVPLRERGLEAFPSQRAHAGAEVGVLFSRASRVALHRGDIAPLLEQGCLLFDIELHGCVRLSRCLPLCPFRCLSSPTPM
jgi:hypothetical protein